MPRGPRVDYATIIPGTVDTMWGTAMTATVEVRHVRVAVFVAVDPCSAVRVGIHAVRQGTRHEALEPVRRGPGARFGAIGTDVLPDEQAALIELHSVRIAELQTRLSRSKTTSKSSHLPSSSGTKDDRTGKGVSKKPRPSRPGTPRRMVQAPDEIVRRRAEACGQCRADVLGAGPAGAPAPDPPTA